MDQLESQLHDGVTRILGPDGYLTHAEGGEGGMSFNPIQYDYALHVASGFCGRHDVTGKASLNMLQAATGTGKTLGYLVPLMLYAAHTKARVAVSTFTRHLQKQLLSKDAILAARWVSNVTGITLSVARRVGSGNYVSPVGCARLTDVLAKENAKGRFDDAIELLAALSDWAEDEDDKGNLINSGVLDDYLEENGIEVLPEGVVRRDICLTQRSPDEDRRTYLSDVAASQNADVLVVNHALMAVNAYRWAKFLDVQDGRKIEVAVFDEADRLADAAQSVIGSDVAVHRLLAATKDVANSLGKPELIKDVQALHDHIMGLRVPARESLVVEDGSVFAKLIDVAYNTIRPAIDVSRLAGMADGLITEADTDKRLLLSLADEINDLMHVKEALHSAGNTAVVSWSPVRAYPSIRIGAPNAGLLMARLWNVPRNTSPTDNGENGMLPPYGYLHAALFTSATLATPGKTLPAAFDEFAHSVGIIRHPRKSGGDPIHDVRTDLMKSYQPTKFGTMRFVLADPSVNDPTAVDKDEDESTRVFSDAGWLDYCATMIRTAAGQGGRVLVLTLSWRDTQDIASRLGNMERLLVHRQGDPLRSMLATYQATEGAVLITPSAWEGVDLPGLVNQLVITRIPNAPPGGIDETLMRAHLENKGFSQKKIDGLLADKRASAARRKLAQGLGRGIRASTDSVTVWVADPRFPYPDAFASSLDPSWLAGITRRSRLVLRDCIPQRFYSDYNDALLCLADGSLKQIL